MTLPEIIEQLEGLKLHCEDWIDRDFPDEESIWAKDAEALERAIELLKRKEKEDGGEEEKAPLPDGHPSEGHRENVNYSVP